MQGKKTTFKVDGKELTKTVRLFLGGDYQFLATNYGHTGACNTDFCLFCTADLDSKCDCPAEMQQMWGEGATARSLQNLEDATGKKAVFPIEPRYCVPLPLHIALGLCKSYMLLFRDEV